ncbi:kinase-like domain-containing protein [Camillea tinctor]|nr:kinase-like domain-containing protein [Camillea tinctor]
MSLDGGSALADLQYEVKSYFTDSNRFEFEKPVGSGSYGFGLLFNEKKQGGTNQRFVIKRAFHGQHYLMQESDILHKLEHADHIVNLVHLDPNPLEGNDLEEGILGPYIIMEYLENGTINDFTFRTRRVGVPNRVLAWIFLCLTRACIGMAYPPGVNPDGSRQEEVVDPSRKPSSLAHFDMHSSNLMFGSVDPSSREHNLMPILKLIDFGCSSERETPILPIQGVVNSYDIPLNLAQYRTQGDTSPGVQVNIKDIANVVILLAWQRIFASDPELRALIQNQASNPGLDPEMRLQMMRCIAADPENRPKLDDLVTRLQQVVNDRRTAGNNTPGSPESDAAMQRYVQRYVLNAPVNLDRRGG